MPAKALGLQGTIVGVDEQLQREFDALLLESSVLAFRVAWGVLRHREDAEDVAQEAMARAYRNFRQLRDRTRFRAWLVRIAWRLAINRQRGNRRRLAHEETDPSGTLPDSPDRSADGRERARQLWDAIDALPRKLRLAIVLSGIHGHDVNEVALLLRVPPGTVKSRLFHARQRLKELLQ